MHDEGICWPAGQDGKRRGAEADKVVRDWESQGRTVVFVAVNAAVVGCLALSDAVREEAVHEIFTAQFACFSAAQKYKY